MATVDRHVTSWAEARGNLQIARTYINSGVGTAEAVDHICRILEWLFEQMGESVRLPNHAEPLE